MDALMRAGGLYNGHGHPVAEKPLVPYDAASRCRPVCNHFYDADMVHVHGPFTANLILCLPADDELRIEPDDVAEIVMVLERGGIVMIHGFTQHAPRAAWQTHIQPLLGGGRM